MISATSTVAPCRQAVILCDVVRTKRVTMDDDVVGPLDMNPRVREIARSAAFWEPAPEDVRREHHLRIEEHYVRVSGASDVAPAEDTVGKKGKTSRAWRDQPREGPTLRTGGTRSGLWADSARATAQRARAPRRLRGSRLHRAGTGQCGAGAALRFDPERASAHPSRRDRYAVRSTRICRGGRTNGARGESLWGYRIAGPGHPGGPS